MIDLCCWCGSELDPLSEGTKTIIGSKTQLEWYICRKCQVLAEEGIDAILNLVKNEDARNYEEDNVIAEAEKK